MQAEQVAAAFGAMLGLDPVSARRVDPRRRGRPHGAVSTPDRVAPPPLELVKPPGEEGRAAHGDIDVRHEGEATGEEVGGSGREGVSPVALFCTPPGRYCGRPGFPGVLLAGCPEVG